MFKITKDLYLLYGKSLYLCKLFFLYMRAVAKNMFPFTQSISSKHSEHFANAFLWESYHLRFRVIGEEDRRDKGHGRSRKRNVLPSRAGLCSTSPFSKIQSPTRGQQGPGMWLVEGRDKEHAMKDCWSVIGSSGCFLKEELQTSVEKRKHELEKRSGPNLGCLGEWEWVGLRTVSYIFNSRLLLDQ